MKLLIVYGSETLLLKDLINEKDVFIRIYNESIPSPRENCEDISINDIEKIDKIIKNTIEKYNVNTLVFIGAAFYAENKIYASLTKDEFRNSNNTNILNYQTILQKIIKCSPLKLEKILIFLSSFRAHHPTEGTSLYSASKAYGETLFKSLAFEYSRFNLRTFIIQMGYFEGRMKNIFNLGQAQKIIKKISLNRYGKSKELIDTISFIIENKYLSGGKIEINGALKID